MQQFLQSFNALDWTLTAVVLISAIAGFMRGIIRSLFSIAGIILGVLLAGWYSARAAEFLHRWVSSTAAARAVAFLLIFVTVALLVVLLGHAVRSAASLIGLGFADRFAGALFGVVRGFLGIAALLIPLAATLTTTEAAKKSVLLPCFLSGSHGISFVLPRDLRQQIADGVQSLRTEAHP